MLSIGIDGRRDPVDDDAEGCRCPVRFDVVEGLRGVEFVRGEEGRRNMLLESRASDGLLVLRGKC